MCTSGGKEHEQRAWRVLEMAQLPNSGSHGYGNKATPLVLVWKCTACRHGPTNLSARRSGLEVLLLCSLHAARDGPWGGSPGPAGPGGDRQGTRVFLCQHCAWAGREAWGNMLSWMGLYTAGKLCLCGENLWRVAMCSPSLVSFASSHWQWFLPCLKVSSKPCGNDSRWFC